MGISGGRAQLRPKFCARFRPWTVMTVLAVLAVRAAIPSGWMPNPAGVPAVPLVICTAEGGRLVTPVDGAPTKRQAAASHQACVFAGFASTPVLGRLLPGPPIRFALAAAERVFILAEPASPSRHRDQSPRAPPRAV